MVPVKDNGKGVKYLNLDTLEVDTSGTIARPPRLTGPLSRSNLEWFAYVDNTWLPTSGIYIPTYVKILTGYQNLLDCQIIIP